MVVTLKLLFFYIVEKSWKKVKIYIDEQMYKWYNCIIDEIW